MINQNWAFIEQLFGRDRILHTIERGPTYVPPPEIYGRMLRVIGN